MIDKELSITRKLATIRTVDEIRPIEGADAIECAIVDGWQAVVKKGEFEVGDLCFYFEIDSVLPICEEFEFLRKGCYVKKDWLISKHNPTGEGFRLKTIRLRGQISQGLVTPFPEWAWNDDDFYEGADITNHMQVVKWDPPVPAQLSGIAKGNFPSFIPKTDQERIQNIKPRDLEKYYDYHFEMTIKMDGSSMTMYRFDDRVGVCSRNLELDIEADNDTTFATMGKDLGVLEYLNEKELNFALQGELMGPGIQGNREKLNRHIFFLYDVYDINNGKYLNSADRLNLLGDITQWQKDNNKTEIAQCPIISTDVKISHLSLEDFLDMADGSSYCKDVEREGVVFKCIEDPSFSFKVISNKYLLKHGD